MRELRGRYSSGLWDGAIPIDTKFRDASRLGLPLPIASPRARGAQAYGALLESLIASVPEREPDLRRGIASK